MKTISFLIMAILGFGLSSWGKDEVRPLQSLSTDKPIYRRGEVVRLRDIVLDGMTNYPLKASSQDRLELQVKILGPRGDEQYSSAMSLQDSTAALGWRIPDDAPGGLYTARVECADGKGAPAERKFEVKAYRVPRLKTQIEFLRRGYLPGEECAAVIHFERSESAVPEQASVRAMAVLDGQQIFSAPSLPAANGTATVRFRLPKEVDSGDGTLSFTISDGGVVESAAKTIPVLLDNYRVEFYPEGGDLVSGVPQRIYVEATRKDGRGADIAGQVVDANGGHVADFATAHDGRGIVEFIPAAGVKYQLLVASQHGGAHRAWDLPAAKPGAALRALQPAYAFKEPLRVAFAVSPDAARQPGYITLSKRDQRLCKRKCPTGTAGEVLLDAGQFEGVLIATLYAQDDTPLAERLLFRAPERMMRIGIEILDGTPSPRSTVKCRITTRDEKGSPIGAVVGLTVTDDSALQMIDRREQAPRLPEMVYLENEVRSFSDAADYLNPDDPQAAQKIDLLLGTQGWRRFVAVRKAAIEKDFPDALKRLLAPAVPLASPVPEARMVFAPMMLGANAVEERAAAAMPEEELMVVEDAGAAMGAEKGTAEDDDAVNGAAPAAIMPDADIAPDENAAPQKIMAEKKRELPRGKRLPPVEWVREYAHKCPDAAAGRRNDFTETIYWNAGLCTDPRTGSCEVSFELPDTIGSFAVIADGFASNGMLGKGDARILSRAPFYAEMKLPPYLTAGDEVELPVTLVNNSDKTLDGGNCTLELPGDGLQLTQPPQIAGASLSAGERRRAMARFKAVKPGTWKIALRAVAGGNADAVEREVTVLSRLFPLAINAGARIDAEKPLVTRFTIPAEVENGTQVVKVQAYTSPAATMTAALNALLQRPHGCFEQTSSTNYPLVMAQQYFLSHSGVDAATIARSRELLDEGYRKLVSFECSRKGYEWFGQDPGHEALTAYGLMEFADMEKVMPVDRAMIDNTRDWLLGRRDGQGGFARNEQALDSFGRASAPVTDAYIVWALLESGEKPQTLEAEIKAVREKAAKSHDSYLHALAANIMALAGDDESARSFARMLAKAQLPSGEISGAIDTITCSQGQSRALECASLAAMGWMRCGDEFVAAIERTMGYIAGRCQNGRFGSTQSTVLALKAINAYDQRFAIPLKPGKLQLFLDGKPFGSPVAFDEKSAGILALPDCGLALTPGDHAIEVRMTDGAQMSVSIEVAAMTALPENAGTIIPEVTLSNADCTEGDAVEIQVAVTNNGHDDATMPLAVIAIPGGLEVRTAQLQELRDAGRIAAYELNGNAVVLYWRGLKAGEKIQIPLSTVAAIPGRYVSAASRSYRYYTDDAVQYLPGIAIRIQPR